MKKKVVRVLLCMALFVLPQMALAYSEPTVTITLDKNSVKVGEMVTATYEVSGKGNYIEISWDWWIETEDGKNQNVIVEDNQCSEEMTGSFSITPQFGHYLSCSLHVVEDTGRRYWFDSKEIKILGDKSKEPNVRIIIEPEEAKIGEDVTATYEVTGKGNYTEISWDWWIRTEDGKNQNVIAEDNQFSEEMTGSFSITPQFGHYLSCSLHVVEDTGRRYWFDSEEIKILGDKSKEPNVRIVIEPEEAKIGGNVTATYEVLGRGNYTEISWDWWIETEDGKSQNVIVEDNQYSEEMTGSFSVMPRFGHYLNCSLHVVEDTGRRYWFDSERIPIRGYAPSYDIYNVIEGQDTQASNGETSLLFRADGEFKKYLGVQVNGKAVPSKYVKAWSGSTYVELSAEYIASLPEGTHELTIIFEDGVAVTTFTTVKSMPVLPKTGDRSMLAVWMMLLVATIVTMQRRLKRA